MKLYTPADAREARQRLRRASLVMAAVLLPMLAGYVLALVQGDYARTAVLAIAMLFWCIFFGDLVLAPKLRCARFLKELNSGLRRSVDCVPEYLEDEIQMQDGVHVRCMQVRMADGDSRKFYVNAAKMDCLPDMGRPVRLVSYGRHAVEFVEI